MTRPEAKLREAAMLLAAGRSASEVARQINVPRSTVRDWGRLDLDLAIARRFGDPHDGEDCPHRVGQSSDYAFVLGTYLGDGCLSRAPRGKSWKLRVVGDQRYPSILDEWALSIETELPSNVGRIRRAGCVELWSHSPHWLCLLPQHGPGKKHERRIRLESWQETLVRAHPAPFVRGLLFSDGCRVINRVGRYRYTRYFFSNTSEDIHAIAMDALRQLGLEPRRSTRKTISIARSGDVAALDDIVGSKH